MDSERRITRRQFLEKSSLLASAAVAAGGAKKLGAQINNAAGPLPRTLRAGFIGVGIRGTELLEASHQIGAIDTVVACDLYAGHLARAKELTAGAIETCGEYERVLERPDIDCVIAAVPDHWHKKILLDALSAGKHVYIEKPLTHKFEDGAEMVRAVEASGRTVQVGSQYLSMKCSKQARDFIAEGGLGKVVLVDAKIYRQNSQSACYYPIPPDASPETVNWQRFLGDGPVRPFDAKRFFQWRLFWDYSGGLTTDLFVHLVSATHYLLKVDAPETVCGFGAIYYWKDYREVPDQIAALATYPQGFMLKLTTSVDNGHRGPELTFYGTEGTMEFWGDSFTFYHEPSVENFRYSTHSYATETVEKIKQIMDLDDSMSPRRGVPKVADPVEFKAEGGEDSTTAHLRNFYEAVREGRQPVEDIRFGVNAVNVAHMVNLSCKTGKFVKWNAKKAVMEA
ncbi:MAG TPA: Gfo/Idh/MocA family oxidoreductase [Candidatus Glassbacteria bacterium]|nr:Gfo/Idh/MocA family oxidoreductase [Candidatus Glassbacteria bacterium]